MLAHALEYALLLCVASTAFFLTPPRFRWGVLCASGLAFLLHSGPVHVLVAIAVILVNYAAARAIDRFGDSPRARWLLFAVVLGDVATLVAFKHVPELLRRVGLDGGADLVVVPLGLSYYVFQVIGNSVEVYWGRCKPELHLGRYAAAVLFFPKLVSGPIERPERFFRKLGTTSEFRLATWLDGVGLLMWGVFKKCVIADRIAQLIDPVYATPAVYRGAPLTAAVVLYAVQIYCDFSGYTDIALGSGACFGIELTPNFDHPFASKSISEFWRRWHISLSSWVNDYVYKPLALAFRSTRLGTAAAVLATFFTIGIWHGPKTTFIVFGLLHGTVVAAESLTRDWKKAGAMIASMPGWLTNGLTVAFYAVTCVFFRANSVSDALLVIAGGLGGFGVRSSIRWGLQHGSSLGVLLGAYGGVRLYRFVLGRLADAPGRAPLKWAVFVMLVCGTVVFGVFTEKFVYEQF